MTSLHLNFVGRRLKELEISIPCNPHDTHAFAGRTLAPRMSGRPRPGRVVASGYQEGTRGRVDNVNNLWASFAHFDALVAQPPHPLVRCPLSCSLPLSFPPPLIYCCQMMTGKSGGGGGDGDGLHWPRQSGQPVRDLGEKHSCRSVLTLVEWQEIRVEVRAVNFATAQPKTLAELGKIAPSLI